ncbi:MAG: hypothetical protein CMN73_04365 [Sphingomonas sp.]|nr:hypothetical protein [Sphingomonas sp.]|tara:strand:+ start:1264 stop:1749 length:486 start_codon:yes stop_codon:yes gene_type:complete
MLKTIFVAVMAIALAACGKSSMVVLQPVSHPVSTNVVQLVYENSTVGVPDDAVARTKQYMDEEFFTGDDAIFRNAEGGVTIRYGYIGFEEGSRVGRYFLGALGNDDAKMVLRAQFFDAQGNKIGEIQSEGTIGGGFFGGSSNSAIRRAVREVASYARAALR